MALANSSKLHGVSHPEHIYRHPASAEMAACFSVIPGVEAPLVGFQGSDGQCSRTRPVVCRLREWWPCGLSDGEFESQLMVQFGNFFIANQTQEEPSPASA